jgi:hypothetical protein
MRRKVVKKINIQVKTVNIKVIVIVNNQEQKIVTRTLFINLLKNHRL